MFFLGVQGSKTALVPGQAAETHQDPPMGSGQSPGSASDKKILSTARQVPVGQENRLLSRPGHNKQSFRAFCSDQKRQRDHPGRCSTQTPPPPRVPLQETERGENSPPIEVHPLSAGPRALCTVRSLRKYLRLTGDVVSGPLFLNSRTSPPVLSSTVSKWLSEVIEDAGPGS